GVERDPDQEGAVEARGGMVVGMPAVIMTVLMVVLVIVMRMVGHARSYRPPDRTLLPHCMNQPWLTTIDWPVRALLRAPAKNSTQSATSSVVVNSPSTVSFSMTCLMTSASEMLSSLACSGICLSTSGVRTKPGQTTLARTLNSAPSLATTLQSPISPCLAVTYGAFSLEASLEC